MNSVIQTVHCFLMRRLSLSKSDSIVWSPFTVHDIEAVESVQRRFTKGLPGLNSLSYLNRLKRVNLLSLELRRLHTDHFYCYKMLSSMSGTIYLPVWILNYSVDSNALSSL